MAGNKKNHKKISKVKGKQLMALDVRDYRNDPFVVKKLESAKKLIEKYGLPKELLND
ncbi:hypothetical protein [Niastella vici]|uniref:hypothetical protein n=1 Tax=Niastella vici TaxID=1703345 RepID=UPI001302062A|nr:hypothetical protein [Niastella vici]